MAYTTGTLTAAQMQVAGDLEEAALIAGAGQFKTYRRIMVPLMAPALINVTLWVIIHAVRELAIALTLDSPSAQVLSTQVWGLWQGGQMNDLRARRVLRAGAGGSAHVADAAARFAVIGVKRVAR